MSWAPIRPVEKHWFLLELWAEPREVATRLLRLRGRIQHLPTSQTRSVASLADVDEFVHERFAEDGLTVEWEAGP